MKRRFENKIAIITGAGQGIGRQVALDMASEGANIVAGDIVDERIAALKQDIEANGGQCIPVQCDVANRQQVDDMVKKTVDTYERIDILINNAGIGVAGTIEETTDELIDNILNINLKGVLYTIRAVTPIMKAQKYGRIVNVSSMTGKRGDNSTVFAYGASKGGIIALTRSTARQLGPFGITCNAIAPHAIMTPLMSYWDEAKKYQMAQMMPVRRLGTAQDVSYLLMFLASDESSFITGETVNINGGYYMD